MTPFGWDVEFDQWVKKQLDNSDFKSLVEYEKYALSKYAVPTPDHYVQLIYSLGVMDKNEKIQHTFEEVLPAFGNRGGDGLDFRGN